MSRNPHKVVRATATGISIHYTTRRKCWRVKYDPQNSVKSPRDILGLCGSQFTESKISPRTNFYESLTPEQNRILNDALRGLSQYPLDQQHQMGFARRKKIKDNHAIAQKVLNKWKQQVINSLVDDALIEVFHHSRFICQMIERTKKLTDGEMTSRISFSELGITRWKIAEKLVNCGVLPNSFFNHSKAA